MLKIIVGGQTGVDRAALDAAGELGIAYGGWCPEGGWAEDMPEPPGVLACYPFLRETPQAAPEQRTEWNIRDSDALLVLVDITGLGVSQGTMCAVRCAARRGLPHMIVDLDRDPFDRARAWLAKRGAISLCIAGPRESEAPGIYAKAKPFLRDLLDHAIPQAQDSEPAREEQG